MEKINHCLIIDDDQDDQEIFILSLKDLSENIHCLTANNGQEAISMITSDLNYTPNFIFLDVNMPKMSGIECLKQLKKIERLNSAKIFMYSTTMEESLTGRCNEIGVTGFIVKPSKTIELKEKLSKIFNAIKK